MIQFYLALLETDADRTRLSKIITTYEPELRRYATFLLKSDENTDDILQESFVKVIRAYDDCRKKEGQVLKKWLLTIVKNTIRDFLRRENRYDRLHHGVHIVFSEEDEEPLDLLIAAEMMNAQNHPQDEVLEQLQYQHLTKIILSMPENYVEILEKSLLLGMSNREISTSMQISENTVATRLRRGKEFLIKELEKEGITYDRT